MGIADAGLYVDVRKDYSLSNSFFGLINAVLIYNRAENYKKLRFLLTRVRLICYK